VGKMTIDLSRTKKIIEKNKDKKGALIGILQEIQSVYGYVPRESVDLVAREMSVYPVNIYGILTFYAQFYLQPRGRHIIRVCQGTACHVMGGKELLDYLSRKLGIADGQTTKDGLFSLERVACLGCCGMAPVIMINNEFYGGVTIQKLDELVKEYSEKKG